MLRLRAALKRIWSFGVALDARSSRSAAASATGIRGGPGAEGRRAGGRAAAGRVRGGAASEIGGAHFHATSRFTVGPSGGTPNVVTTTTDVWVDRTGNYRFREQNDRDGGREVVLYGRELSVALRYGKMIRRVAEEPEPSRLLEEAVGAPFAVFDLVRAQGARRARGTELVGGARATVFELQPGDGAGSEAAPGARRAAQVAEQGVDRRAVGARGRRRRDGRAGALRSRRRSSRPRAIPSPSKAPWTCTPC